MASVAAGTALAASTAPISAAGLALVGLATVITTFGGIGLVVVGAGLIAFKIRGR